MCVNSLVLIQSSHRPALSETASLHHMALYLYTTVPAERVVGSFVFLNLCCSFFCLGFGFPCSICSFRQTWVITGSLNRNEHSLSETNPRMDPGVAESRRSRVQVTYKDLAIPVNLQTCGEVAKNQITTQCRKHFSFQALSSQPAQERNTQGMKGRQRPFQQEGGDSVCSNSG